MKKFILLASTMTTVIFTSVQAQERAMPLGIDLGIDTCKGIYQSMGNIWGLEQPKFSVWSGGTLLHSKNPGINGLDSGRNLYIVCDENDKSLYVSLTISKNSVSQIANQLSNKYQQLQRNLPQLGSGYAAWKADNANIEIKYVHVSFDATLSYITDEAKTLISQYQRQEQQRKQQETASQL